MNKIYFKMYAGPVFALLLSVAVSLILGSTSIDIDGPMKGFRQFFDQGARYSFIAGFVIASVWGLYSTVCIFSWKSGVSQACDRCGGLVVQRDGRHGLYRKCIQCGRSSNL